MYLVPYTSSFQFAAIRAFSTRKTSISTPTEIIPHNESMSLSNVIISFCSSASAFDGVVYSRLVYSRVIKSKSSIPPPRLGLYPFNTCLPKQRKSLLQPPGTRPSCFHLRHLQIDPDAIEVSPSSDQCLHSQTRLEWHSRTFCSFVPAHLTCTLASSRTKLAGLERRGSARSRCSLQNSSACMRATLTIDSIRGAGGKPQMPSSPSCERVASIRWPFSVIECQIRQLLGSACRLRSGDC